MIMDYARSTGFPSYCRMLGTQNGRFNTPLNIDITFVLIFMKVLICLFYINGMYLSMMISWMMFCRIIGQVLCPRFPENSLFDTMSDPIEMHSNGA